ncbi:hypothetical protein [Protofrankia symbiont of Coriaria ruscifolia]|uniref:hypothetical protein n=1 Tax=Protofrankia symbiont of Coriaria ruscifolia TaxID=1306542 RepID=UPI001F5E7F30|nr:hypothetical protein [Protofrankia symbiont of Coriaria ruscifolia]
MRAADVRTARRRVLDLLEGDTAHALVPANGPPVPPGVWRGMVLAALSARPATLLQTDAGVTPGEAAAFGAGVRAALDAVVLAMDAEATRRRTWAAPADGPKANAPAAVLGDPAPGVEPGRLVVVDGDGAGDPGEQREGLEQADHAGFPVGEPVEAAVLGHHKAAATGRRSGRRWSG